MHTSNNGGDTLKKILFLVPDGVGVRNYLYSSLVTKLKDSFAISIWTTLEEKAINEVASIHDMTYSFTKISLERESYKTKLFRESARYARLLKNSRAYQNFTIVNYYWNFNPSSFKLRLFNKLTQFLGKKISDKYDQILKFEERAKQSCSRKIIDGYKRKLQKEGPSKIFITHQRVYALMPICIAARELGIPIISCIYSWDNVPKASLGIIADTYVLWSTLMKDEMLAMHPEIPESAYVVTGSPQFEFYFDESRLVSREVFAEMYGLDLSKKWVCFSGDDVRTSPYDPMYLEDLAAAVSRLDEEIQIVFRRCPVDYSARYDEVLEKYNKVIISIDPVWVSNTDNWGAVFPKKEDLSMLVNVVVHCDVVINLGSTMAHDFAVYDKPCLYVNYNPVADKNWSVNDVYNFHHFKSMEGLDAVGWINDKESFGKELLTALHYPNSVGQDRKKWLEKIVQHPLQDASALIANQLLS